MEKANTFATKRDEPADNDWEFSEISIVRRSPSTAPFSLISYLQTRTSPSPSVFRSNVKRRSPDSRS